MDLISSLFNSEEYYKIFLYILGMAKVLKVKLVGILHLVHTQNFPKKQHFLPPETHTYMCESGDKKY